MASKRIKVAPVQKPVDQARAVWLAGLGAASIAQKRGSEVLTTLIREGNDFQARAQKLAKEIRVDAQSQVVGALAPLKVRAKQAADQIGFVIQQNVASVLAKLGIPSKADIEELTQRVTALSRQLKTAK